MAKYIVPSKETPIVLCYRCRTMYVPDEQKSGSWFYENCPICDYGSNDKSDTIPLWKYNLIKFFRGGFKNNRSEE